MADTLLVILPATLPEGYCWPSDPNQFQQDILTLARVKLPSTSGGGVVISQNTPATSDWDKLWIRTDSSGNLIRNYLHGGYGVWASPHPEPAASNKRYLWVGLEADLKTFDEGIDEPVTAVTGPFWEVDHEFDGRVPMAPGVVDDDLTVIVKDKAGLSKVTLTENQIGPHKHLQATINATEADLDKAWSNLQGSEDVVGTDKCSDVTEGTHPGRLHAYTQTNKLPDTGAEGHPNLQPYYGTFVIKRTARQFYTVS